MTRYLIQLKKLERIALEDQYFVDKKLYPNVDFYSGIIYRALGFPPEMFTVMFAFGRLPGWIAQWKEMRENKEPLGRPRQIYTGEKARDYKEIDKRQLIFSFQYLLQYNRLFQTFLIFQFARYRHLTLLLFFCYLRFFILRFLDSRYFRFTNFFSNKSFSF